MTKLKLILFILLGFAFSGSFSEAQVRQSGTVTPRHTACWTTTGVVQDCGTAAAGFASSIGTTGDGPTICANSASTTGPYNQLCFGASTSGPAQITLQSFGGASPQALQLIINGTAVTIPSTAGAQIITGTPPFAVNHVPSFSTTGGVLVDSGVVASGGTITSGVWNGTLIAITSGGTGAATPTAARANLGLGSMATQDASAVNITGGAITGLPAPSASSDAANKQYVDSVAAGLNVVAPSLLATAAVLPNTPSYNNGASGVGATLTAGSNAALVVDGVTVSLANVVLVKNQASALQNGIYTVTTVGDGSNPWVLTRATYFDAASEMIAGSYTLITSGSANSGNSYVLSSTTTTVGTTPVSFFLYSSTAFQVSSLGGMTGSITCGINVTCSGGSIRVGSFSAVIDARDPSYGVVCDGATNDVAAINLAINAATVSGGTVLLPSGTCIVGVSQISLKSNVTLQCSGQGVTTLKILAPYSNWVIQSANAATNIEINNCTFDMGNYYALPVTGAVIFGSNVSNVRFKNNTIINMGAAGFACQGCTNYDVSKNTITNNNPIPLATITVSVKANNGIGLVRLTVNTTSTLSTDNYVTVAGVSSDANGVRKVTVINGTTLDLQGTTFNGGAPYGGSGGTVVAQTQVQSILFTATFDNITGTINDNISVGAGMNVDVANAMVRRNQVSNFRFGGGITIGPGATASSNNIVTDNIVFNSTGTDTTGTEPSCLEVDSHFTLVSNNVLYSCAGPGIIYNGTYINIVGNNVRDNGRTSNVSGIVAQDAGDAVRTGSFGMISGNISVNSSGASGTQNYGFDTYSTVRNTVMGINNFFVNKLGDISPAAIDGMSVARQTIPTLRLRDKVYAQLPACTTATRGMTASIIDSNTQVWGAVVASGGGGGIAQVYCDGSTYTVVGK